MINEEKLRENRHILPVCEKLILLYNKYSGRIKDADPADLRRYEYCHEVLRMYVFQSGCDTLKDDMEALEDAVNKLKKIG